MKEYKYSFEQHPKKKGTCPNCGKKNKLRYYQDESGERMPEEFGKCDRINECGYHKYPDKIATDRFVKNEMYGKYILPNKYWLDKFQQWSKNKTSNLHLFLIKFGISEKHLLERGCYTDEKGKTVFIFKNYDGQIVNAKWFDYQLNGHRAKGENTSYSMSQPKDKDQGGYGLCLYNESHLDPSKAKTVIIVESEKTALIASFYYPKYDWVSCGSCTGLTSEKANVLSGRKIIWLCDADKAGRDNSSINFLRKKGLNFQIVDLFPDRTDGYDIADAILERLMPDIDSLITKNLVEVRKLYNNTIEYRENNSIWVKTRNNWEVIADDFHIFIKYQTQDENENYSWIIEIIQKSKETIYMEVLHEDWCSAKKMKVLLAGKCLSFKANDNHISEIHSLLFGTKFSKAFKVNNLGLNAETETYFFSNKAITSSGEELNPDQFNIVVSKGISLVMPSLNNKLKKRFSISNSQITFDEWYLIYSRTHKQEITFIPVCFYLMSLFRDVVVAHKSSSPILYLKGGHGTGKSSVIRSLTCLFGYVQDIINLKSKNTDAALVKLMSQIHNGFTWMDEFENNAPYEGLLQAAYDVAGYHKTPDSNSGNSDTDSIDINSTLGLTSNYIPSNHIFFSRCLLINIETKEKSPQQKKDFLELANLESKGLACITVEILAHRNLIKENYEKSFLKISNKIQEIFQNDDMPERILSNMTQALTCAFILQSKGKISICEFTDENDILDYFVEIGVYYIKKQNQIQEENSVLADFMNIIQIMHDDAKLLEGIHYRIEEDLLYLRFPSIFDMVKQKYRNIHNKESADRDTVLQEIFRMEEPRLQKDVYKTIRFKKDTEAEKSLNCTISDSLSITYSKYQQNYNLDFSLRGKMF